MRMRRANATENLGKSFPDADSRDSLDRRLGTPLSGIGWRYFGLDEKDLVGAWSYLDPT